MRARRVSAFVVCFALASVPLRALTVDRAALEAELADAPFVADVRIESVADAPEFPTPYFRAEASLLDLHRGDRGLPQRITIVGPGGKRESAAVAYAGFPEPKPGERYRAFLKPVAHGDYAIVGYRWGLVSARPGSFRGFTRNRVDGTDGNGTGAFLYWPDAAFPVPFAMSYEDFFGRKDVAEAIEKAFLHWRDVPGVRFDVKGTGCVKETGDGNDGINSVHFVTKDWAFGATAIAVTRNYYLADGASAGEILDTDIMLNAVNYEFATDGSPTKQDVENVITHEVGHFWGLGHESADGTFDPDATMYAFAVPGETLKRTLAPHDIAGIRDAYPGGGDRPPWVPLATLCELERGPSCAAAKYPVTTPSKAPWLLVGLALWLTLLFAAGRGLVGSGR